MFNRQMGKAKEHHQNTVLLSDPYTAGGLMFSQLDFGTYVSFHTWRSYLHTIDGPRKLSAFPC